MALSEQRRKFVEAFMGDASGNATEAAKIAGYSPKTAYSQGQRLLKNVEITEAITERQKGDPLVADREERQRFWSTVMRDKNADMKDRLKASEVLGKACGDFIERSEVNLTQEVKQYIQFGDMKIVF